MNIPKFNMDIYTVFGILMLAHLGQALQPSIGFDSPVMENDNVTMTCTLNVSLGDTEILVWTRMTNETMYIYYSYSNGTYYNDHRFEYVSHNILMHQMKLVRAQVEDAGTYSCGVYDWFLKNYTYSPSTERRLDVTVTTTSSETTAALETTMVTAEAKKPATTSGDTSGTSESTTMMSGLEKNSERGKGPPVGVVAGSVVGGVLLLAVILTVSVCIHRRRRNTQDDTEMVENDVFAGFTGDSNPTFNELDGKSDTRLSQNAEGPYSYIPDQTDSANISPRAANPTASGQPEEQAKHMSKAVQGSEPQTDQTASAKSSASSGRLNHNAQPKGQTKEGSKTANGTDTHNAQSDSSKKKAGKKRNGKPEAKRKVTQSVPPTKTGKATTEVKTRADSSIEGKAATHGPQYANIQQLRLPDIQPRPVNAANKGKCAEDVQYDTIDDSTLKRADKDVKLTAGNTPTDKAERKQVVHVSPDKQTATDLGQEVQHTQVDKTKKNNARKNDNQQEGSHYAEVAPTDDGKTESVIVRTVPDTQYSAVKLIAPANQTVDTDSD